MRMGLCATVRARRRAAFTVFVVLLFVVMVAASATVIVVVETRASEAQSRRRMEAVAAVAQAYVAEQTGDLGRLVAAYADRLTTAGVLDPDDPKAGNSAVLAAILARLREARTDVNVAFVTDAKGRLVGGAPDTGGKLGSDFAYRDWFQGAMRSGQPYLSEVYQSAGVRRAFAVAASVVIRGRPVNGHPGPVHGVLAATYPLSSFQGFVDDYAAGTGIRLVILDQRGVLVAAGGGRRAGVDGLEGRRSAGRRVIGDGGVVSALVKDPNTGWSVGAQISLASARASNWTRWVILAAALIVVIVVAAAIVGSRLQRSERRSREEIEQFFRVSPDLLCIAGTDGYFKRINPAWEAALGYHDDELLSRPFLSFVHPDDVAATAVEGTKLAAGSTTLGFENRYRCADGTYRWLLWQVAPFPERGMLYGVGRDITERKAAELALAQLAEIVDSSVDAIIGADLNGVVTSWNHGAERIFGYRPEQIIGRSIRVLAPPGDEQQADKLARAARGETIAPYEATRIGRDGAAVEVALTKSPVRDRHGSVVGVAMIARDISDSKRSAEALGAIIESASDAFISLDTDGAVTEWNHRAETLFGWRRDEVIGRDLAELVIPVRSKEAHRAGVANAFRGGGAGILGRTREIVAVRRDGVEIPAEITVWPVSTRTGNQFSAFVRDVSLRQQFEQDLAEARDKALEASRLKSEFLAMMSHEIRTPMNGVIGLTGLLLRGELSESARHYAERIKTAGHALLAVLNDILDFSKIEAGALNLDDSLVSLNSVVEEVLELVAESARSKGLELVGYCDPAVPDMVRGDPVRIRQILLNFAVNAVKFTERGEIFVHIGLSPDAGRPPGLETVVGVRLEVADTGIGIAPVHRARLFDAFAQADSSTTRRFGGTGLGLAICRELVEAMNGEIGVESRLGAGSVFWCHLPLCEEQPTLAVARDDAAPLRGLHLMVVDDNATSRWVRAEQARAWGMLPTTVASTDEAIGALRAAAIDQAPFDVLIADLHVPEHDGLHLAEKIKSDPRIPGLPIILLSAEEPLVADRLARDMGVTTILTKPVQQSRLYDCLINIVVASKASSSPPAAVSPPAATNGPRVLLAEDNETNQIVASGVLQELGYRVDVANDGVEALELLGRRTYRAVIMDCQMPRMDGYEAAREIRRRETLPGGQAADRIPIIAMTAAALKDDHERCHAAGMDDYLTKPFEPEDLASAIHRWIPDVRLDAAETTAVAPGGDDIVRRISQLSDHLPSASIERLLMSFLDNSRTQIADLHTATRTGDTETMARTAHSLKGAASSINAAGIASLCQSLEDHAATGDLHDATETASRLEAEYDRTSRIVQQISVQSPSVGPSR